MGEAVIEEMQLNEIGKIIARCWEDIPKQFQNVDLDQYVVMPNHLHGIIIITERRDLINQISHDGMINHVPTEWMMMKNPKKTLRKIIRHYKARAAKLVYDSSHPEFQWQSRSYDRIFRNEKELNDIRDYILNNSVKWESG